MKTTEIISEINKMSSLEDYHMDKGDYDNYIRVSKRKKELEIKLEARTQKKKVYKGLQEYLTPKLR